MARGKMPDEEKMLYQAILEIQSIEECHAFFHDLCTPTELKSLQERWRVAQLLEDQHLSYREIHRATGVSLVTIGRVARFLSQESYHGYRLILNRIRARGSSFSAGKQPKPPRLTPLS